MYFDDIAGQEAIKRRLTAMADEGRIAHALLFAGAEGTGALPLAIAFAQYINCTGSRSGGKACGQCPSCVKYDRLVHPDLHFVFPIITSGPESKCDDDLKAWRQQLAEQPYFGLKQWTERLGGSKAAVIPVTAAQAVMEKLSLKTYEARYKVMIIWLPEKMNESASNKLLKILEEPPAGTVFILVSEQTYGILPTILSRTQALRIPAIDDEAMAAELAARHHMEPDAARRTAHVAQGNMVKAIELATGGGTADEYLELFMRLMRTCYTRKVPDIIALSDDLARLSRDGLRNWLTYCLHMLRENFVAGLGESRISYMTDAEAAFSERFAAFVHIGNVEEMAREINLAIAQTEQNGNARIITTDLMLKLTVLLLAPRP